MIGLGIAVRTLHLGASQALAGPFTFTPPPGDTRALKDFRGQDQVLLVFFRVPYSLSRLAQLRDLYAQVRLLGTELLAIPLVLLC
jgi:peroxiredoxin